MSLDHEFDHAEGTPDEVTALFGDHTGIPHSGVNHDEFPVDTFDTTLREDVRLELIDTEAPDAVAVEGTTLQPVRTEPARRTVDESDQTTPGPDVEPGTHRNKIIAGVVAATAAIAATVGFLASRGGNETGPNDVERNMASGGLADPFSDQAVDAPVLIAPEAAQSDDNDQEVSPQTAPSRVSDDSVRAPAEETIADNPMDFVETDYIRGGTAEEMAEMLHATYHVMMNGISQQILSETDSVEPTETQLQALDRLTGPGDSAVKTDLLQSIVDFNTYRQSGYPGYRVEVTGFEVIPEGTQLASSLSVIRLAETVKIFGGAEDDRIENRVRDYTFQWITVSNSPEWEGVTPFSMWVLTGISTETGPEG